MSSVDYYDVQNMIRDARHEITGEIRRAIIEMRDELNAVAGDLAELRYRVNELEQERREAMT